MRTDGFVKFTPCSRGVTELAPYPCVLTRVPSADGSMKCRVFEQIQQFHIGTGRHTGKKELAIESQEYMWFLRKILVG
eukprot:798349-Pelagomonas_calceolata.AAC.3